MRNAVSMSTEVESAQPSDEAAKIVQLATRTGLRPNLSESGPETRIANAETNINMNIVRLRNDAVVSNSCRRPGSAGTYMSIARMSVVLMTSTHARKARGPRRFCGETSCMGHRIAQ